MWGLLELRCFIIQTTVFSRFFGAHAGCRMILWPFLGTSLRSWIPRALADRGPSQNYYSSSVLCHHQVPPSVWFRMVALVVKNPPGHARAIRNGSLIPGLRRAPGEGNGNPLHYSCLENPMDRGAWRTTVHGVTESRTWLKYTHTLIQWLGWEIPMG